ncbi:MAG: N-6 DNA methylase [Trebonia sp.]
MGGSPNSPTFDRGAVEAWLKETGKAEQLATAGRTDTGTALVAVADRFGDRVLLAGQELDPGLAKAALLRLSGDVSGAVCEVHVGDSLLDDQLAPYLRRPAAVVCEPPFDSPGWPETQLTTDPRWQFGIPAPRDGELAWVQHCYAHLRPRGVAVVAVSRRTCVQPSGEDIRAALVRSGRSGP